MIIKFTEKEMQKIGYSVKAPDDYFPECDSLYVLGTFRCPVCQSKYFYVLPDEVGAMYSLILGGVAEEDMPEAMNRLVEYVQTLSYLSKAEKLHLVTGVCSLECEFEWINTMWEEEDK